MRLGPRARRSFLVGGLWFGFALAVGAVGFVLLRACGLTLPAMAAVLPTGWDFCSSAGASVALAAELDREAELARVARQLEFDLTRRQLDCLSRPPDPSPALKLPVDPGPSRPQQSADRAAPLPADRWNKKDVSLLKGCWQLGSNASTKVEADGKILVCTVRASTICFGDAGTGDRVQDVTCPSGRGFVCKAPITATFTSDGHLRTTQPQVACSPTTVQWKAAPNALNCERIDEAHARCRDGVGFQYDFRPKSGS